MSKSKKQYFDRILEIVGIVGIVASFALVIRYYGQLPDSIPRHYGLDGLPDAYSGKGIIWVVPILGLGLFILVSLISYTPALINLPFKVTPENAGAYHLRYSRMIRILNVGMIGLFFFLTYNSIQIGLGHRSALPSFFTPVMFLFFFGIPLLYVIPDLLKAKKKS